ncbi:MAG: choice-of-anchor D domain-containing protein, partial [bacterium]
MTFDATEMCGGFYPGAVVIESTDPLAPLLSVPASLTVTGETNIAVSDSALGYGQVFLGGAESRTLFVLNDGCDVLNVSDVSLDNGDFSVDTTSFELQVGESLPVQVSFAPTSLGGASGTLSITSNDPDTPLVTVALLGTGIAAPDIAVAPDSLFAEMYTGEVVTRILTIENLGGYDLEWDIDVVGRDTTGVLRQAAETAVAGLHPSGTVICDGREETAFTPDELASFRQRLDSYRQTVAASAKARDLPLIGVGGNSWSSMLYTFLNHPTLSGLYQFEEVNYAVDDLSHLDGLVIAAGDHEITLTGATAIREVYDSGRPIFLGMDDLDSNWSSEIAALLALVFGISDAIDSDFCSNAVINPDHPITEGVTSFSIGGYWCNDNDRFVIDTADWIARDSATGYHYCIASDGDARTVLMGENLHGIWAENDLLNTNAVIWMMEGMPLPSVYPSAGLLPPAGSVEVEITFDASDLCGGDFLSDLIISSNDPDEPVIAVPAYMHVMGETNIAVSDTSFSFGPVFIGGSVGHNLTVSNFGCDILEVSGLTFDNGDFSTDTTPFSLVVDDERTLLLTFTPSSLGVISGKLSIVSNDPDTPVVLISLTGEGLVAPEISVTPDSLAAELVTGQTDIQTVTIANSGGSPLDWTLQIGGTDTLAAKLYSLPAPHTTPPTTTPVAPEWLQEQTGDGSLRQDRLPVFKATGATPPQDLVQVELADLTGVDILYDAYHGGPPSS